MDRDDLLAAGDANLGAVLRLAARTAPGARIDDDGRLLLVSTLASWPGPYHNGALRLDRALPPDEVLERATAFFAGHAPGFCLWVAAHADGDLEDAALRHRYAAVSPAGVPRLALEHPIEPATPPDGVTLDEVVDEAGRRDYLRVTVAAYADAFLPADAAGATVSCVAALRGPGVRAVVARAGGRPLAAAMVVGGPRLGDSATRRGPGGAPGDAPGDAVASVQLVGTVPTARNRGLGELCTRWAVAAGFDLGARAIVLEASEAGDPIYRRMGFTEVSRYRWCFGPPPP